MEEAVKLAESQEIFFALQAEAAHARFMLAYFANDHLGMKRASSEHRLLYRRYNNAVREHESLKAK